MKCKHPSQLLHSASIYSVASASVLCMFESLYFWEMLKEMKLHLLHVKVASNFRAQGIAQNNTTAFVERVQSLKHAVDNAALKMLSPKYLL